MDEDPLAALRDLHLPPAPEGIAVWPLVAAIVAVVGLLAFVVWCVSQWRQRWAHDVARAIDRIDASRPDIALTEAGKLLRRAAFRHDPASARIQGDAWLGHLDSLFRTTFFSDGAGRIFADDLYRPALSSVDARKILPQVARLARRRALTP